MTDRAMQRVADQGSGDTLPEIRNDLETALGKIDALAGLLAHLADRNDDLVFFSLQYSASAITEELKGVFERLHAFEGRVRP